MFSWKVFSYSRAGWFLPDPFAQYARRAKHPQE